jgi:hypothetical protein
MALLGASIDPSLFRQDYSGFVNAANTNANAIAGLGQTIANTATDYFKDQNDKKKVLKQSSTQIDAAIKLYPELQGAFAPILDNLRDENISLNDRFASASATPGLIELAIGQSNKNRDFGLKSRELDIQEGNYIARDRASQAAAYIDATKPLKLTDDVYITGDNKGIDILKDEFGNIYDRQTKLRIINPPGYAAGLPLDQVLEQKDASGMPINSVYNPAEPVNAGGLLPELTPDVPQPTAEQQAILDAGGAVPPDQVAVPQNANPINIAANLSGGQPSQLTPRARSIGGDGKAETQMTAQQVQDLAIQGFRINARPLADGSFMVSGADIGGAGETIESSPEGGFKITRGGGGGAKAEAVAKAQEQTKNESFRLNQANTEEAFTRLDTAGTNNPVFAAGNALLAEALPASETGELAGFYERINSENSFIKMNQQRASSPTGGSAGSMTEKEWPRYEGRFSPLKTNAKKDTIAKSLSLNLLNSFEAVNGTPDDVIKLLNEKKIDQVTYDNYVSDYITNRQIARVNANGVEGKSYEWTKLNKNLLSKSTIYEAPTTSGSGIGLDQGARDTLQEFLPKSK